MFPNIDFVIPGSYMYHNAVIQRKIFCIQICRYKQEKFYLSKKCVKLYCETRCYNIIQNILRLNSQRFLSTKNSFLVVFTDITFLFSSRSPLGIGNDRIMLDVLCHKGQISQYPRKLQDTCKI